MGSARDVVLELRRAFFAEEGSAELDGAEGARMFVEAVAERAAEGFTVTMDGGAMTTTYEGSEGMLAGWSDFLEPFETIRIRPEGMLEAADGESVVEFVRLTGRPAGTEAVIEHEAGAVWRVSGGLIRGIEFHMSRDAALRSAGIETPASPQSSQAN